MRTTINLRDEAFRLAKERAEQESTSLGEIVSEAILVAYRERAGTSLRSSFELPASGRGGLMPGVDLDSSAALEDVMDGRS